MQIQTLKKLKLFEKEKLKSLEKLANQGFCNTNYKLKTSKRNYLVRVFKSDGTVNISRSFEYKTQKKAWQKGFAPKPLLLEKNFMITKFEEGIHKEKLNKKKLKELVNIVKKLHKIKSKSKVYNFRKDFKNYSKKLKDENSQKLIKKSLKELKKISKEKKHQVTTHHDLNPMNILFTKNQIKILDWEYAGVNNRFFDLATICVEFKLDKKLQKELLKQYFGKVKKTHIKELDAFMIIYLSLCELWFKANKD